MLPLGVSAGATTISGEKPTPSPIERIGTLRATADSVTLGWITPPPVQGAEVIDYLIDYREVPPAGAPRTWIHTDDGVSTARTVTVSGLKEQSEYEFRIVAASADAHSAPTLLRQATGSKTPGIPANVVVSNITTDGTATASWEPSNNGDVPADYYTVEWREVAEDRKPTWGWLGQTTLEPEATLAGLEPGRGYELRVSGMSYAIGRPGPSSRPVPFGSATSANSMTPLPVSAVGAYALGQTEALVMWLPPYSGWADFPPRPTGVPTGYRLEYREFGSEDWVVSPDTTAWESRLTGLRPGTSYEARVTAYNEDGLGEASYGAWFSTEPAAEPEPATPEPVTGVRIRDVTAGHATASWDSLKAINGVPVVEYRVQLRERDNPDGEWWYLAGVATPPQTSLELDLLGGRDYQLRVVAVTSEWVQSTPSEVVEFHTPAPALTAPRDFTLLMKNDTAALFAWNEAPEVEGTYRGGYQLEYRPEGVAEWSIRYTATSETSYAIAGLQPGVRYTARLRAVFTHGPGPAASEITFTTAGSGDVVMPVPGGGTPPAPPAPGPAPTPAPPSTSPAPSAGDITRAGGIDRYDTAARVSAATFKPGVKVAYVTTGTGYADALAGAPAAAFDGGPVLLVRPSTIPSSIMAELARLKPERIVVLGGEHAVSAEVLEALGAYGRVSRQGGADRYETSAVVSSQTFAPGVPVAYVATGNDYADALSGAAAAGGAGPVLLTRGHALPSAVADELERLRPARIVVLGGEAAVSREVVDALGRYTRGEVTRQGGADRYATSAKISAATFTPRVPVAYVATGTTYADALTAAAAAGGRGPVLLVRPGEAPASVLSELKRLQPGRIVVLGGEVAISEALVNALGAFVR